MLLRLEAVSVTPEAGAQAANGVGKLHEFRKRANCDNFEESD